MNELQTVEHNNQRVLTTKQLAEGYDVEEIKLIKNFNNNKSRYIEGKHYNLLKGEDLKDFKGNIQNLDIASNVNVLYLWTERGALLHAKSLNTDKAWEVYDVLVETYFNVREAHKQLSTGDQIALIAQGYGELNNKVDDVISEVKEMKHTTLIDSRQCGQIKRMVDKRVSSVMQYYNLFNQDSKSFLYSQINKSINNRFESSTRTTLLKKDFENIIIFIDEWFPNESTILKLKIMEEE